MNTRKKLTVSYRVLDSFGDTIEVFKKTGYNKNLIQWLAEKYIKAKFKTKQVKLKLLKIVQSKD